MNPVQNAWETRKWTLKANDTTVDCRCGGGPVLAPAAPKRIPQIGKHHVGNENYGEDGKDPID